MIKLSRTKNRQGVSLIEVMIALTILSTLILPSFMFIIEYTKGGSEIGDRFEILSQIEQRLEIALSMPYSDIPEGKSSDTIIKSENGRSLDLKQINISNKKVSFECLVEVLPVTFSAIKDYSTRQLQKITIENGIKKITIIAKWGKGNRVRNIDLVAYKSNL
jgi:prepilin-type N-terminal cleavage/methylation domain-containing protein